MMMSELVDAQITMDSINDVAFGRVSEEHREEKVLSFEDNFSPPTNVVSAPKESEAWRSDGYLQSLEAKLQRLKGKSSSGQPTNKRLTSRDILRTLDEARQDAAMHLISSNSAHNFGEDVMYYDTSETQVAALKRRMFPEQALSAEELQELTTRDFLQAAAQQVREDAVNEETLGSR